MEDGGLGLRVEDGERFLTEVSTGFAGAATRFFAGEYFLTGGVVLAVTYGLFFHLRVLLPVLSPGEMSSLAGAAT